VTTLPGGDDDSDSGGGGGSSGGSEGSGGGGGSGSSGGGGGGGGRGGARVILGHQHRTLAAALAGRGSGGWGRDPHLGMFVETAARRGGAVQVEFS
jgi:hypothetical protein